MSLRAGKLRHRVQLQQFVAQTDTSGNVLQDDQTGEVTKAWTTLATVWAAIEPLSAREFIQSAATQSEITARITIRYRAGLTADMRLVHGSTIYNPQGFLPDKESGLEYLTIPCSQGVNTGE
jgi:SPP1 family predicted phage head-tail adaptor